MIAKAAIVVAIETGGGSAGRRRDHAHRLRHRVLAAALARAPAEIGLERGRAQDFVARLAAAAGAQTRSAAPKAATLTSASLASRSISVRPRPPLPCSFSSSSAEDEQAALEASGRRRATCAACDDRPAAAASRRPRARGRPCRRAGARAGRRRAPAGRSRRCRPAAALRRRAGEVVRRLRAGLEIDQRGDRLAVAAPARQRRDRHRVDAAVCCRRRAACRRCGSRRCRTAPSPALKRELAGVDLVALERAHPALEADDHRHRLVDDRAPRRPRASRPGSACAARRRAPWRRPRSRLITVRFSAAGLARMSLELRSARRAAPSSSCSILIASSRASWRRRMSRMSSACRSLRPKRAISAGFGSSAARMMRDHLVDVEQHQLPALRGCGCGPAPCRADARERRSTVLLAEARSTRRASGAGSSASAGRRRRPS